MIRSVPQAAWGPSEAVHLLSRLQFGVRQEEVDRAVADGLDATLDRLLSPQAESAEFVEADDSLRHNAIATGEIADLKAWWLFRMQFSANPLTEKLALFWHNHFATSNAKVRSVPQMLAQNDLFRQHATRSFRGLLHAVSRDPAMLVWLDGNANRKRHPNENFAREVMELFSLGIGNYTERDIQEAARAFTGWHLRDKEFWFNVSQHDATDKTIFGKTGRYEGAAVIDLCLDQPACPKFLATKLLRMFVTTQPSEELVTHVAERYRHHDLATGPVLRDVCRSSEFFAPEHPRAIIKSPLDFVLGTLRPLAEQVRWPAMVETLAKLGQDVFEPPSVKGWDGGRQWLPSTAWIQRWNFVTALLHKPEIATLRTAGVLAAVDPVPAWEQLFFGGQPSAEGHDAIVSRWAETSGNDRDRRVRTLHTMLSLPEYQLM
ncbi:MAG TPA: DUF1800 domain-containing protein [Planctomycetaceae bacterium]|nr:DUF1800 domain-containing protein [Planctomycetaceae bacterium]